MDYHYLNKYELRHGTSTGIAQMFNAEKKGHLTLTPCLLVSTGFVTGINPPQCASLPLPLHLYNNQFVCLFTGSQQTSSWDVDPPLDYWISCTRTERGREGGRCRGIWWTWFIKHSHHYHCSLSPKSIHLHVCFWVLTLKEILKWEKNLCVFSIDK